MNETAEQPRQSSEAGETSHYPPAREGWIGVLVLTLMYILATLDRNIVSLFADDVRRDLQISDVQLGLLIGPAFGFSYALGALPFGWAMDRYSRRAVLWSGVTIWSLATVACGLSRDFVQLIASRILVGAGEAALVPGNQSILADLFPPSRLAFPISVYSLGSKVGQGLSLIIGGALTMIIAPHAMISLPGLPDIRGWQAIFILIGLPGLILALSIFLISEPRRRIKGAVPRTAGYKDYVRHVRQHPRFFVNLHIAAITATMVVTAVSAWTPAYLIRVHGMPVGQVGFWLGTIMLAGALVGTPLHGLIADHLFRRGVRDAHLRHLAKMLLLMTLPLIAGYLVSDRWLSLALFCISHALLPAFIVLMPSALQLMVPSNMRGKAASVLLLATAIGGVSVGPALVAAIAENIFGDPHKIGLSMALFAGVGLPLAALLFGIAQEPLAAAMMNPPKAV